MPDVGWYGRGHGAGGGGRGGAGFGGSAQLAHLGAFGELLGAGGDQRGQLRVGGDDVVLGDVLDERVQGGDHLVVPHHLRLGDGGLAVAVVPEAEQVAHAAPVAVAAGGNGVKHGLGDLRGGLGGQAVGQLDAGGVVGGLLQLGLHAVEGGDEGQLPAQRLFAGEAHGEEHEAFAGHAVGSAALHATLAVREVHDYLLKIEEVILRGTFTEQNTDCAQHVVMAFAKELCDLNAGGGDDAVVDGKLRASGSGGCRRTESDVSHGEAPVDGLLSHHLPCQEKVVDRAGLADRQQAPAHPCGCPHTAHRKPVAMCAQTCFRKQKAATIFCGAAAAPVVPGCQAQFTLTGVMGNSKRLSPLL